MGKAKVPIVLQIEMSECGAASLCMVLGYYGRFVELSEMRRACHISRDGSRLRNMMHAAEEYGLQAEALRCAPSMTGIRLPAIAFWKGYHFIVVEKIEKETVTVCDPALGRRRLSAAEFTRDFSGVVLQLTRKPDFVPGGKPYSTRQALQKVLGGKKAVYAYLLIVCGLLHVVTLVIPGLTRLFVDQYLPSLGNVDLSSYLAAFLFVLLVQFLLLEAQNDVVRRFGRIESGRMNGELVHKLLRLPVEFFQTRSHSMLMARLESIDAMADFVTARFIPLLLGLAFSLVYVALLLYYSGIICAAVLVIIAAVLAGLNHIISHGKNYSMQVSGSRMRFMASAGQNIHLFDIVKSTAQEDRMMQETVSHFYRYENENGRVRQYEAVARTIPVFVPMLLQVVVVAIGMYRVWYETMTVGEVLACQSIAMSIFEPIAMFVSEFGALQSQESDLHCLHDIEMEPADELAERKAPSPGERLRGKVELRQVSFRYNAMLPPVLQDINVIVEPGKSLAIVGGSGSGKSTMLKLIEGLYAPGEGTVLLDDCPLAQTGRDTAAGSIAVVQQKTALFRGTVRDNITLFNHRIPTAEVERAAENACILEDILKRGAGFGERLTPEECTYSGGQVQRMMLARALVRNPSILIMDEATSALDPEVEEAVMKRIGELGMTRIVVAHRLSTIRDCDEIVVMNKGTIAERGTHEELFARTDSLYRRLVLSEEEV